ncbi:hypothetical protein AA18890_2669 [Komagataeibacter europaeus LMG 18890]|nr:hypothetical protein AA18890_2669 [Komagataeibacter europaeus LMG 18890]
MITFRFQKDRIHKGGRGNTAGLRLKCLRPTDFTSIYRHGGIVRHILGLERPDRQATVSENPA